MTSPPCFDILGLGVTAVDDLLFVEEYPPAEAKVRVARRLRQLGGLTGMALLAAARLGAKCAYAGCLGVDPLSQFVLAALAREGIETRWHASQADAGPAHSTIIVDQRHATRTVFASLDGAAGPPDSGPPDEAIRAARTLLIDHHGMPGTLRAVQRARAAGIPVVADFERDPGGLFTSVLACVDHLVVSRQFAAELSGHGDPARAAAALAAAPPRTVVVTGGRDGCWACEPDLSPVWRLPAFEVAVVDSTGCGDVFHGAYALALAEGMDLHARVRFASAAAALRAKHYGSDVGCRPRAEVEQFLRALGDAGDAHRRSS